MLADSPRGVQAIDALDGQLSLAMLWTANEMPPEREDAEIVRGQLLTLTGYLGAFQATFQPENGPAQVAPFDLVLDTRREPTRR